MTRPDTPEEQRELAEWGILTGYPAALVRIADLEAALRRTRDIIEGALLTSAMQEPCPPVDYPAER